jgi:flagellar biosynthesis GTPase FlhF
VVVTNQRIPVEVLSGEVECTVCTDTKSVTEFPGAAITKTCTHPPTTCLDCIATSIRSDLNNKLWNEIRCPECRETLQYDDVQRYADAETRERYQTLSFRYALSEADNFIWCTSGCGYGQVHDGGADSPIVICLLCSHRSCFSHRIAWHENLSCEEYDALQQDPTNFRSRFELENEAAEEEEQQRRVQEDADRVFAQSLVAEELRAEEVARHERAAREAREAREREERSREERRLATEAMRAEVLRKKEDEERSAKMVAKTTKPCPGCGWAIEKNRGW